MDVIGNFVVRTKQERFREFIVSRRDDLLDELFIDERNLKPETLIGIPRGKDASFVVQELQRITLVNEGNIQAYIISSDWECDGKVVGLVDAIEAVFDQHSGGLIYCINKGVAYYEDREISKYILRSRSIK